MTRKETTLSVFEPVVSWGLEDEPGGEPSG
jgi:hypothetical protein